MRGVKTVGQILGECAKGESFTAFAQPGKLVASSGPEVHGSPPTADLHCSIASSYEQQLMAVHSAKRFQGNHVRMLRNVLWRVLTNTAQFEETRHITPQTRFICRSAVLAPCLFATIIVGFTTTPVPVHWTVQMRNLRTKNQSMNTIIAHRKPTSTTHRVARSVPCTSQPTNGPCRYLTQASSSHHWMLGMSKGRGIRGKWCGDLRTGRRFLNLKLSTLNHTAGRPHGPRTQVDKSREQSSRKCQFRLHVSPACQSSGQPLTSVPFLGVLGRPRVNTRTCTGTPRIPYIGACAIPYHELYGGELTLPYVTTSTKLQDVYKRCCNSYQNNVPSSFGSSQVSTWKTPILGIPTAAQTGWAGLIRPLSCLAALGLACPAAMGIITQLSFGESSPQ
eukprot:3736049-Rhodomonas_salina.5